MIANRLTAMIQETEQVLEKMRRLLPLASSPGVPLDVPRLKEELLWIQRQIPKIQDEVLGALAFLPPETLKWRNGVVPPIVTPGMLVPRRISGPGGH